MPCSPPTNANANYRLYVGNQIGSHPEYHNGLIDELRLWDYARTEDEIRAHMHEPLGGGEDGLVGYWSFDSTNDLGLVPDLCVNGNDGILMGHARLVDWDADIPTAIARDASTGAPRRVDTLAPNYPNPFNGHTTIRFDLASPAEVELSVHSLLGQRVATLLQGARGTRGRTPCPGMDVTAPVGESPQAHTCVACNETAGRSGYGEYSWCDDEERGKRGLGVLRLTLHRGEPGHGVEHWVRPVLTQIDAGITEGPILRGQ